MHAHPNVFAKHGQILSKIELIAQFAHRSLALMDLFHLCGRKQPLCQCVLSHARARSR